MKNTKKILLSCLGAGLASYISVANAAENEVLFKIHDIVPIKNAEGNIVSCELGATFYNRMKSELSNASVDLVWNDEVIDETIEQEERTARENRRLSRRNTPRYTTSTYNTSNLSLSLKLPPLKSQQQVTLKSKINTDRCFLLLGDVDANVTSCGTAQNDAPSLTKSTACANLFRFVSPQSPEYYSEFKAISTEQQEALDNSQIEKQRQEIEDLYNQANQEINRLNHTFTVDIPAAQ